MRWNMLLGALVISVGLSSQSFGFDLLDRMLGLGCGCDSCRPRACCEKPCGEAAAPACGCKSKCRSGCGGQLLSRLGDLLPCNKGCCNPKPKCCKPKPKCCKPKPKCCKPKPKCCKPKPKCCKPKPKCCKPKPKCCPKPKCRSRCGSGLLDIFQSRCGGCNSCRKTSCGGCSSCGGGDVEIGDEASPMPPAPTEDTSAMLQTGRRVLNVSSVIHQ